MGQHDAIVGEILGEILGELEGAGVDGDVLGAIARKRGLALQAKPAWRKNQITPGVSAPGEFLQMLPLTPDKNNGVFDAATPTIIYTGKTQKPFQGERIVSTVRRSGAVAVTIDASTIVVGVEPQTLQIAPFDLEVFSPNAFGVRLKMDPSGPGIECVIPANATPAVAGADFVTVRIVIFGHAIK